MPLAKSSRAFVLGGAAMVLARLLPRHVHEIRASVPAPVREPLRAPQVGLRPNARRVAMGAGVRARAGTALMCDRVQDWLLEQCEAYRCMHVRRPRTWGEVQHHVDRLASSGALGRDDALEERVQLPPAGGSEPQVTAAFAAAARRLVGRLASSCLPESLGQQIQLDVVEVGRVLARLLPAKEEVAVKLEVMGENCCSRWHQDMYTCRAIITYNGRGTEYVEHGNVDFWELNNCGNNDHILREKSRVFSANAADVLFMKGKLFPGAVNGLVHKSPEKRYHADGTVMNRLCLKLDMA